MKKIRYIDFRDDTEKYLEVDAKDDKEAEDRLVNTFDFGAREYRIMNIEDVIAEDIPSEWTEKG